MKILVRCTVPGCERESDRRRYCTAHYMRWRKTGDPGPAEIAVRRGGLFQPTHCGVPGCERKTKSHGYCNAHYLRWRHSGDPGAAEVGRPSRLGCEVSECEREAVRRGYCDAHYRRWRRNGDPGPGEITVPGPRYVGCSVPHCERPHIARGYCNTHYNRWHTYGDAEAAPVPAARIGVLVKEVVGYHGVHARVRRAKGKAAEHLCRECSGPAAEWAYTNDDPAELTDAEGHYSLDVDRYVPMCPPCHWRFDQNHRDGVTR